MKLLLFSICCLCFAFIGFRVWMGKAERQAEQMKVAYTPDRENRKSVDVAGWRKDELDRILIDFRQMYGIPSSDFAVESRGGEHWTIVFPADIEAQNLYFLVNYLSYPKGFDLRNRAIYVLGRAKLSSAFGIPEPSLDGLNAEIYAPTNDRDFDNVYVQVENNKAFKISFTRMLWELVNDPRKPSAK